MLGEGQTENGSRRLRPRLWHHDWLPLVRLRRTIAELVEIAVADGDLERAVDLGCGSRPYQPLLAAHGVGEYVGCDLDDAADVVIEPGRPVPLGDGCADLVVSFQVLEHVWELDWYLSECRRLAREGGWLLLSTHGSWLYHPHPGDYRRWTRAGLRAELEERGLVVQHERCLIGPLAWSVQIWLLGLAHVLRGLPLLGRLALGALAVPLNLAMVALDAATPRSVRDDNSTIYVLLARNIDGR